MVRAIQTFLLVLCASLTSAQMLPLTPQDAETKKKEYEENTKKQIPNVYNDELFKKFKVSTPLCEDKSVGNCAISAVDKRYFVPKKDLPTFTKINLSSLDTLAVEGSFGMDGATSIQHVKMDGKTCNLKAEYDSELDTSNAELVSDHPPKNGGTQSNNSEGKNELLYTDKGKTYRLKDRKVIMIPKLRKYSLAPESVADCKDLNATLLLDLEKRGLTERYPGR